MARVDLNSTILGLGNMSEMIESLERTSKASIGIISRTYTEVSRVRDNYFREESKLAEENYQRKLQQIKTTIQDKKKQNEQIEALEKAHIKRIEQIQEEALQKEKELREKVDAEIYKKSSALQRKQINEQLIQATKAEQERLKVLIAQKEVLNEFDEAHEKYVKQLDEANKKLEETQKKQESIRKIELGRMSLQDRASAAKERADTTLAGYKDAMDTYLLKKQEGVSTDELEQARKDMNKASLEAMGAGINASLQQAVANLASNLGKAIGDGLNKIDSTIDSLYASQGRINAMLSGTDTTYQKMLRDVSTTVSLSPYVSQKSMIENITKLVDTGVSYNIEQRAFLATVSENIAKTFDVFDSNLMRLIRLQQADSTAARLGMEAFMVQFLNSQFSDTSYLQNAYDSVSQALLETSSQLSRDQSFALEWTVQKWLGSLSSLGMSESAVQSIAQGVNYLGSGNIPALSSNPQLMTLLGISASRAGIPFGQTLIEGISGSTTNALLYEMVRYLKEIAETDNKVVKSTYGQIFGLTMSDFRALANLSASDMSNIFGQSLDYGAGSRYLNTQLGTLSSRLSIGQMMNNVFDNLITGVAAGIGSNVGTYATWKITDLIEKATGGINIPAVFGLGTGVDMNATVTQLMKLGIAGVSTLSLIGPMIQAISKGGPLNLSNWGGTEWLPRGYGFQGLKSGVFSTTSEIQYFGGSSSEDVYRDTLIEQREKAEETQSILGTKVDEEQSPIKEIKELLSLFESMRASSGTDSLRVTVVNDSSSPIPILNSGMPT